MTHCDVATAASREASPMSDGIVIEHKVSEGNFVRSSG
jgi:hypothetical protein